MRKKKKQEVEKVKLSSCSCAASSEVVGQAKAKPHTWVDDVDWFGDKNTVSKSSS